MDITVSDSVRQASRFGDAHLVQPITAEQIAGIPSEIFVAHWAWYRVIGNPGNFANLWVPHYHKAALRLPRHGWWSASFFFDPDSVTPSGFTMGSKIFYESEKAFKALRRAEKGTAAATDWAEIVADLGDPRWGGHAGDLWPDKLKPGMILVAGDPLPPYPEKPQFAKPGSHDRPQGPPEGYRSLESGG